MSKKIYFGKDLEAMSFAQNYHKWILDEISPYLGNNVAEVGAGTGNFTEFLLGSNIKHLVAFEPSDNMFVLLKKKYAKNSKVNTVNNFFEDLSMNYIDAFDSVCYVNVLEHIKDDREALSHAYKTLRKNGHILIFVPALAFLYSNLDKKVGHYRRYSKIELINTVLSVGFSIEKVKYFDIAGIIPWYIAFVLLKQTTTEGNVSMYDKVVVPIMRKIEHNITPIIGKNLILVGRKA
jgi:SAM-dependent methyltransferase